MATGTRELTNGYKISYDKAGVTAQRVFLVGVNVTDDGSTLPYVGDVFDSTTTPPLFPSGSRSTEIKLVYLYCTKIDQSFYGDDVSCYIYTCYYSNEPIDNSNIKSGNVPPTDTADLPQDFQYTGEYQLWKVASSKVSTSSWTFEETGEKIAEAIPFRIRTYGITIQKIVTNEQYDSYTSTIRDKIGKINSSKFLNNDNGCWLFTGAKSELFRDHRDNKAYKFELNFSYRDPDGLATNGWNKILSDVGDWKTPVSSGGYLYQGTIFDDLIKAE